MKGTVAAILLVMWLVNICVFAVTVQPSRSEPGTWVVDDDGPADFHAIQEAINAPEISNGDTIFVKNGTYDEDIIVNKSILLFGERKEKTIIHGDAYAVRVQADNVTVEGLTIRSSMPPFHCGVIVERVKNCSVTGNRIENNYCGILLSDSSYANIVRNDVISNMLSIRLFNSSYNTITENNIVVNAEGGIVADLGSGLNRIYRNNFVNNSHSEIHDEGEGNVWDNGYDGNYWSDYNGSDLNSDGIGEEYVPWQSVDQYPLMSPYLYADVNHDAAVNMTDIGLCINAFGSYPSHPRWNPHSDINEDGKVDMRDIGIACKNFMKTWSEPDV